MNTPLPQLERLFVTDAGLETDLIYNRGVDLTCFASIMLLHRKETCEILDEYFRSYLELARRLRLGCLLESASWRASADWAPKLRLAHEELGALNRASIEQLRALRAQYDAPATPVLISGCIGPRGDGYDPGRLMTAEEAESYHSGQARVLASAGPDLLSAITMNNVPEAIGISRAAEKLGMPVVISFTVETDGCLPTGQSLEEALTAVDRATRGYAAYFMISCAHPTHFRSLLTEGGEWTRRVAGIRLTLQSAAMLNWMP